MKIIVGNWKMNGSAAFARNMIDVINKIESKNKIIICPPAPLISLFKDFRYEIGAQNCFFEEKGAFTGENSPVLLRELGCKYVLVGHSERRSIFCESDDLIYKKWRAIVSQKLTPILCIGEKLDERNNWKSVLSVQLKNYVNNNDNDGSHKAIFAYEPVWSIGTGFVPTNNEIETRIEFIKSAIGDLNRAYLLYGGSVNAENAAQILHCKNVNGVLIGGASLKVDEFKNIVEIASN
jgi:triosephosphate isomerase